jgi:hypothetical protein
MVDPNVPFTAVRASRGKVTRAEPVAALYEQGRIHHVGSTVSKAGGDRPGIMLCSAPFEVADLGRGLGLLGTPPLSIIVSYRHLCAMFLRYETQRFSESE